MQFAVTENRLSNISADVVVFFAYQGKKNYQLASEVKQLPKKLQEEVISQLELDQFEGKKGEIEFVFTHNTILAPRVAVVGLGEKKDVTHNTIREVMALLTKKINKSVNSIATSCIVNLIDIELQAQVILEGVELGTYRFANYKERDPAEKELEMLIVSVVDKKEQSKVSRGLATGHAYYLATKMARDLVNEQAAIATPTLLAKVAEEIALQNPQITCTVFDKKQLEEMGAFAFLGIARGADTPPKFIVLEYTPKVQKIKKNVALVGKGITFDTGGINVKPEGYMTTMKQDMAGGAAVLGVFSAMSVIKPSFPVLGIIAATPNVVSGSSIVPGDVVHAMNGKSIEVNHTDAEGRVTLADSLSYAVQKKATEIIDLATLTGACMVGLGTDIAGVMGNDTDLIENLKKASIASGEKIWELPLPDEYKELNKSEVADVSNLPSSRYGGAITAGLFLQEFVDNTPWAHIDIAGPAFAEREYRYGQKGGTGFGVRLLLNYLRNSKS
ncbi:MAG TPA: leucyl aminopeptidase [Candidatus Levybacteria bacterium]|nr:leucyl aminopeptidase [Candidatus Levybacteria bacterium]